MWLGPAGAMPQLRQGEARAARFPGGQPALYEALCPLRGPALSAGDDQGHCGGAEARLGYGQIFVWILYNQAVSDRSRFDPYPYILLNLILSCLAALQAPVIMMSQKRQEVKDRMRSQSDYRIDLKAELEIRHLHEKMDHLISRQWQRLTEIQQMQLETMHEMSRSHKGS